MKEELEHICFHCNNYYPDGDGPTEYGICLNDSEFEPYMEELIENRNFDCCKELIKKKKFDGGKEACDDFEMVDVYEDPELLEDIDRLEKKGTLDTESIQNILVDSLLRNKEVDEYKTKLTQSNNAVRLKAVTGLSVLCAYQNKKAQKLLLDFFEKIPPPKTLEDVHFKIAVLDKLSPYTKCKVLIPVLVKDLYETSISNTTRQWIDKIFIFFEYCDLEDIREPLTNALHNSGFTHRIKAKIKDIIQRF